jgi:hypothetical protein
MGGAVALALGLFKIFESLVAKLGSGGGNGKMCLMLEQSATLQRDMLTEQRTTNEILRETRRDHESMGKQLERLEKVAAE